jgi:hypothetical protein
MPLKSTYIKKKIDIGYQKLGTTQAAPVESKLADDNGHGLGTVHRLFGTLKYINKNSNKMFVTRDNVGVRIANPTKKKRKLKLP